MVQETVEQTALEGAATEPNAQEVQTVPAPVGEQAPETQAPAPVAEALAEPSATDTSLAEIRSELAETRKVLSRLERANRSKDRFITATAGAASVQEVNDRVDLQEAKAADRESSLDQNTPESAYQKTLTAIAQRKSQEAQAEDFAELSDPLVAMGMARSEQGVFLYKTPEEEEIVQLWGDGSSPKARRAAIRLANRYAREKGAAMTTTTTPTAKAPATNGAAPAPATKVITEADLKAAVEKAAKEAREQARVAFLQSGGLDTTPAGAAASAGDQELVNKYGRGEPTTFEETLKVKAALARGIYPKLK